MNYLELFAVNLVGNFVFYMGVRTYYRVMRSLQENAFQKLIKSGQVKLVSMEQLQGMTQEKDEKKSWN